MCVRVEGSGEEKAGRGGSAEKKHFHIFLTRRRVPDRLPVQLRRFKRLKVGSRARHVKVLAQERLLAQRAVDFAAKPGAIRFVRGAHGFLGRHVLGLEQSRRVLKARVHGQAVVRVQDFDSQEGADVDGAVGGDLKGCDEARARA